MILICYYFCFLCPSYKILLNAKVETTQKLQHNNNSYKSSILTTEALLFWQLKPGLGGRHLLYPLCMNLQTHIYIVSGMFFFHILDWVCLTMLYSIVMITMSKISYYLLFNMVGWTTKGTTSVILFGLLLDRYNRGNQQANFNVPTDTFEDAYLQLLNL